MKRILVVDDDPDVLDAFQAVLESENFSVFPLLSPVNIFKTIKNFSPDLIILDIMLSGMDGRAVFLALKSDNETANIPIIMASARFDEAYITSQKMQPDDFLDKPFNISDLVNKVNYLIKN